MNFFAYIICLSSIVFGGFLFDKGDFGTAVSTWLTACLISIDSLIDAIKER